ncbi:hypoxanthine phosphoribosyltransferase [Dehalococcoidia bacterium]|nr:hypoxanthine phosphoribosyltransferase [Dehalococcoidia bacterium]MCL0102793.1 hypoxanthine phosphoribosyltransferase [Dehalococcoidia bacterium]
MESPKIFIARNQIRQKVAELAERIRQDYVNKNPLLIGILKGSFVFLSDLIRLLDMPLEIDFIRISSYGSGKESSGKIEITCDLKTPITDRDVLVVEDIVDTGLSLSSFLDRLRQEKPASIRLCALLDKPSRRKTPIHIDYPGFTIPDRFVVGYGLDFDEKYRYLPDICYLEDE